MSSIVGGTKTTGNSGQNQTSFTDFRPEDLAALRAQQGVLQQQTQGTANLAGQLQRQAAGQGAPTLQGNFNQLQGVQSFQPGQSGIDALGRATMAQGTQALNAQAGTQATALRRQFAGSPGVGAALGRQASMNARLQANPLLFTAAQQSADRGQQGFQNQLGLAGQQANLQQTANHTALQQQQANSANRQEQLGFGQAGLNANQALLASLSQLANQFGTQQTFGSGQQQQRSGGTLQNLGVK